MPQPQAVTVRGNARKLVMRVAHVKCLVLKNLAEHAARLWVLPEDLLVDCKSSSGSPFGKMEKSEKRVFLAALDAKVVQAALSGREPIRFECMHIHPERRVRFANPRSRDRRFRPLDCARDGPLDCARDRPLECAQDRPLDRARDRPLDCAREWRGVANPPQDCAPAEAKELGMALLILRVAQEKSPQKWIWGQLGGAREIATAVLFGLGEAQQLVPAAGRVRPNPAVQGPEQPIEAGRFDGHWHVIA